MSSSKQSRHLKNVNEIEKDIEDATYVQKVQFVLALHNKISKKK